MMTADDIRRILAELEALAPRLDCDLDALEIYADFVARQARVMDFSDVSSPEALLLAALIRSVREQLQAIETPAGLEGQKQ